ncbi:MAG: pyrroloquinoline quinone biosynthesis peptide chaperone PqqD [Candidatus Latescibacter sp.]|nr:pyrroloquinoline quinone biosynthesis peptide chaperone PqqD [Candidatus Latescibacter sp.]
MVDHGIPKRASNLEIIEMADGIVIQCDDVIHTLNETAREVFDLCDGKRTVSEIIEEMKQRYPEEKIDVVIEDFIANLLKLNLIQI